VKHKDPLTLLNTAGLLALGVGALLFGLLSKDTAPPSANPGDTAALTSGTAPSNVGELQRELSALRGRVALLEAASTQPGESAEPLRPTEPVVGELPSALAEPGSAPSLAPLGSASASQPVRRDEVRALVVAELEKRRRQREAKRKQAAKKAKKPRRTLREVAQELNLQPHQEREIRGHLEHIERETMRVLFELGPDADLKLLEAQLEQAKHDPELKEKLRETVAVSWTKNQANFWALYVKLDAKLRKVLPKDTLAGFYKYDVKLEVPRFPDIEKFFFKE
jgi:hypothetical protein